MGSYEKTYRKRHGVPPPGVFLSSGYARGTTYEQRGSSLEFWATIGAFVLVLVLLSQ